MNNKDKAENKDSQYVVLAKSKRSKPTRLTDIDFY
jgi:hypothetical protein